MTAGKPAGLGKDRTMVAGLAFRAALIAVPVALVLTVIVMMRSDLMILWALPIYAGLGLAVMLMSLALALIWSRLRL